MTVRCRRCLVFVSLLIDCLATRSFVSHLHWNALCCLCCELLCSHWHVHILVAPPPVGERSVVMSVSVHTRVTGTAHPNFTQLSLSLDVAQSCSDSVAIHYVVLSVLWMTSFLHIVARNSEYEKTHIQSDLLGSTDLTVLPIPRLTLHGQRRTGGIV